MGDTLEQRRLDSKSLDHFYTKNMGNLNNNILNHFLHYLPLNHAKYYTLKYATSGYLKEGGITAELINQHLSKATCKEAVILTTSNGTQGHAVTL